MVAGFHTLRRCSHRRELLGGQPVAACGGVSGLGELPGCMEHAWDSGAGALEEALQLPPRADGR